MELDNGIVTQKRSSGEQLLARILQNNQILKDENCEVIEQYTVMLNQTKMFRMMAPVYSVNGRPVRTESARFDFAICKQNTKTPLLFIEFDGQQHYNGTGYMGSEFQTIFLKDKIKDLYALHYDIPLIRVPYGIQNMPEYEVAHMINRILSNYFIYYFNMRATDEDTIFINNQMPSITKPKIVRNDGYFYNSLTDY